MDVKVDQLVARYLNKHGRVNAQFTRQMREAPIEVRDAVWKKIRDAGLDTLPDAEAAKAAATLKPAAKSPLADEDWDLLAESALSSLCRHPGKSLVVVANGFIKQFPREKQRRLSAVSIKPLVDRLAARLADQEQTASALAAANEELLARSTAPDRAEILSSLSDDEVLHRYGARVLAMVTPADVLAHVPDDVLVANLPTPLLVGQAVQRSFESFTETLATLTGTLAAMQREIERKAQPAVNSAWKQPALAVPPKVPRVAIVGALPEQFQRLVGEFQGRAQLKFVDRAHNGDTLPACEYVLMWTAFVSHSLQSAVQSHVGPGTEVIRYGHRGIEGLAKRLAAILV